MYLMLKRSTKRALIISFVIAASLMAVWGIIYRFTIPSITGETLLAYVPASSGDGYPLSAVAALSNPAGRWRDLKETDFYLALKDKGIEFEYDDALFSSLSGDVVGAFYGGGRGEVKFLMLGEIRDIGGIRRRILEYVSEDSLKTYQHRGLDIRSPVEGFYYAFEGNIVMAASSSSLLEDAVDLRVEEGRVLNFNSVYPWVEGRMGRGRYGYLFTSGENFKNILPEDIAFYLRIFTGGESYDTYREIYFEDNVRVHSFTPDGEELPGLNRAVSLSLMPAGTVLMKASVNMDFDRVAGSVEKHDLIDPDLYGEMKEVFSLFGKEASFSLQPSRGNQVVPGILVFIEDIQGSYPYFRKFIEKSLDISLNDVSVEGVDYAYGRLPLFLTSVDISLGVLKVGKKEFITIATSRELFEKAVSISAGREESLGSGKVWKKVEEVIPSRYSSVYYADIRTLGSAARPLLFLLAGDRKIPGFLAADPFRWIGPSGGATVIGSQETESFTLIPVLDVDKSQWLEIFSAVEKLISG